MSDFLSTNNQQASRLSSLSERRLPEDYVLSQEANHGWEGFNRDDYLILWCPKDAARLNQEYEVTQYLTNVVLFGSNGGGEAYGFSWTETGAVVVKVPFIGMCDDLCEVISDSFSHFFQPDLCDNHDVIDK